jgi:hypothetical protein
MDGERDPRNVDGNAIGGLLGEVFAFEMTTAEAACTNCGAVAAIGALPVYASAIGTVVRCGACGAALIRIARIREQHWLDLRGLQSLRVAPAP